MHRERGGEGRKRSGEQRKRSEQKKERERQREREKGVEERRYGEARMLHRVAALSLHCVPLRHSLVQRFIQLGVPRTKVKRSQLSLRAPTLLHLSLLPLLPLSS